MKTTELFTIAPLKWESSVIADYEDWKQTRWRAEVPFGSYAVVENWDNEEGESETRFTWEYHFREYHDENEEVCASVEDGKAKAEADWRERLALALVKAA